MKILIIKFKFLGDVVISTPLFKALRKNFPQAELHVLVGEEATPLLKSFPWVDKVWGLPRQRGKAQLTKSLPILRKLRAEKFDISLDLVGNDRGALASLIIGAKKRYGLISQRGFFGRSKCYHHLLAQPPYGYEVEREMTILNSMGVSTDHYDTRLEIYANPILDEQAAQLIPPDAILCHISSVQPKKEWPVDLWRNFAVQAADKGMKIVFSAGTSEREQQALQSLCQTEQNISLLPRISSLELYLSVLKRAKLFISGDTGPMHFAIGLGVPTITLFAASDYICWLKPDDEHIVVGGEGCSCPRKLHVCASNEPCMRTIQPEQVLLGLEKMLDLQPV